MLCIDRDLQAANIVLFLLPLLEVFTPMRAAMPLLVFRPLPELKRASPIGLFGE